MRAAVPVLLLALLGRTPATADEYPTALVERPQLLPPGLFQVDATLGHQERRALGIDTLSAESSELAVRVGLGRRWELGAASPFWLHPDARWDRAVALAAGYHALEAGRIDLAPTLALPVSFRHGYDLVDTAWLGLGLKARLGERLFAVAGRRLLPVDIRPAFALHVVFDGGIGVQATPQLALLVETQAAALTLLGPIDRTTTAAERWPLSLTALWATDRVDTSLQLRAGDALAPGDDLAAVIAIGVRP